ncbi:MAG: flagellar basal body P-ring formation chaperone FlgA, partial [Acidobacteriota bacterium]
LLIVAGCGVSGACMPLGGDRILGRDLALADPRFSPVPASLTVAFAPVPGTRRVFTSAELARLAKAHGIAMNAPAELCFEVPLRQVPDEEFSAAMQRSLPPGVEITLVDRSKTEVPAGDLVFPPGALDPAPAADQNVRLWRGYVRYTDTRKFAVWARVRVTQKLVAVVAGKDLARNVPLDVEALRVEPWTGPVLREPVALRLEDVVGHILKRPLQAGAVIPLALLEEPPAVRRGEAVQVEVLCGPARLQLDAIAEREGRVGEIVELRNPSTGKLFRARLDGTKAVVVVAMSQKR